MKMSRNEVGFFPLFASGDFDFGWKCRFCVDKIENGGFLKMAFFDSNEIGA